MNALLFPLLTCFVHAVLKAERRKDAIQNKSIRKRNIIQIQIHAATLPADLASISYIA